MPDHWDVNRLPWPPNTLMEEIPKERLRRIMSQEAETFERFVKPSAMGPIYWSSPSYSVVPMANPPVQGGIMDTLKKFAQAVDQGFAAYEKPSKAPSMDLLRKVATSVLLSTGS